MAHASPALFLLRRLAGAALTLLLMSLVIYALIGLMPGDPIDLMAQADPSLTTADAQRLKAQLGLDRPLLERWLAWLARAGRGELGYSRLYAVSVGTVLWPRLLSTLALMGAAFATATALALPLGVWTARHRGRPADRVVQLLCSFGIAVPTFWLGIILILFFAVQLGWLPASGQAPPGAGAATALRHLVLPVTTLAVAEAALLLPYVRAAMAETLALDFIRTARACGIGPARLLLRHALRHAMLPVATIIALNTGALFSGALVVETIFARLGMGRLIYDAILGNDYNLALAALLLATAVTLLCNLLADLAYLWLDPRIALRAG